MREQGWQKGGRVFEANRRPCVLAWFVYAYNASKVASADLSLKWYRVSGSSPGGCPSASTGKVGELVS